MRIAGFLSASVVLGIGLLTAPAPAGAAPESTAALPRPDHVVILVEENHAYSQINGPASYLTSLADGGARFTQSFGVTHPSEPNYLALFSGSTQGLTNDSCPHTYSSANLGSQLIAAGYSFAGYSQNMPSDGYTGCISGAYARKHNPWVNFTNVPAGDNLRFSRFPADFTTLPTVSFVIPDQNNDMHNGTVATGDTWARTNLDAYAQWARTHNSLLIVTFDEDDNLHGNQIFTAFYGAPVKVGNYPERITHYSVLRTIEDLYGLSCTGSACSASTISDVWQ